MVTIEDSEIFQIIENEIKNNDVVLYMKGTADFPQCGFSGYVAGLLKSLGVVFKDVNVLSDNAIRDGIKSFTDWPTIPQLYVKGEFIGGCDIVKQMHQDGEFVALLKEKNIKCNVSN